MKAIHTLLGATMLCGVAVTATAADAATTVFTSPANFIGDHPTLTDYLFPNNKGLVNETPSYTLGGVTFASNNLYVGNDGAYLAIPYLDSNTTTLTVTTGSSAIGFFLGAFSGAQTLSYTANGVSGTLALGADRAQSFLGFDSGGGPLTIAFKTASELDVTSFSVASSSPVPEPASWALMIGGVGVAGGALRRRRPGFTVRTA